MKFNTPDNIFRKIWKNLTLLYKGYLENTENTVDSCEIAEAFTLKLETRQGWSLTTTSTPPVQLCPAQYTQQGEKDERIGMRETKFGQMMGKEKLDDCTWQISVGQASKRHKLLLLTVYRLELI